MNKHHFLLIIITFFCLQVNAQTKWVIQDTKSFDYILTTTITDNKITGQTRNNALKDYIGDFKFSLAKATSSLKYSEIVHFDGVFSNPDKIQFKGSFNHLFSEFRMEGYIYNDSITINLYSADNTQMKTLRGVKLHDNYIIPDYVMAINRVIQITEEKLYSPEFLDSKDWKAFKRTMQNNSSRIKDNLELQVGLVAIARDFPFSHYNLMKHSTNPEAGDNFTLKEINDSTCLLDINSFSGTRAIMDSLITIIHAKNYDNLIIDLRDNPGGDNESAAPLMEFIVSQEAVIGIFPNKSWYSEMNREPVATDYAKFNEFSSGTLNEFYEKAANGYGLFLKARPGKLHFNGKLYVIINKKTASTAEIIALALKENKLAIIVGQTSAGMVLSAKKFRVNDNLDLFIPLNDYISYGGLRIDKKGVKPDLPVKNEDEVNFIMERLKGN